MIICLMAHLPVDTSYSFGEGNLRLIVVLIQCVFCMAAAWKAQKVTKWQ
jgi:hypothetical protein